MAVAEHLQNPPIKEAIIDIRFAAGANVEIERIADVDSDIVSSYPIRKPINQRQLSLEVDETSGLKVAGDSTQSILGSRYEAKDGSRVVQLRQNGLTFSMVNVYTHWEDMFDEVQRLWPTVETIMKPEQITRVSTRYINVIPLPFEIKDFSDFLTSPPEIPQGLPQALTQFLTRIVVPCPEAEATAVITQALEAPPADLRAIGHVPVILDIDVIAELGSEEASNAFWDKLSQLRKLKNDIFFSSITDKTKGLFQ